MGRRPDSPEKSLAAIEKKRARERLRYKEKTAYKTELYIAAGLSARLAHNKPGPDRRNDEFYGRIEQYRQKYGLTKKEMARKLNMKPDTLRKGISRAIKAMPIKR